MSASGPTISIQQSPPSAGHPLRLPYFRNLWIGSTVSLLGDQFYLVALPWLVLQLTGSSLVLGTVLTVAAVPRALLMFVGGAVTDRVSARTVLLATAAIRAILVGIVASLIALHVIRFWHLYLLTFAFGVADAFSLPAGSALLPTLLQPQQLPAANAFMQSSNVMTQMAGPAPAGLLIRRWGIAPSLFLDALSFLAAIAALFKLPRPTVERPAGQAAVRPKMWHSILEGLRTVRQDRPVLSLMTVSALLNFCIAGPVGIGLASVAKFKFGSAAAFGTFLSCFSGGMLAGLLLGGLVKKPRRRGLQFALMAGVTGLELVGIGLKMQFAVIATLLALMGLAVGFVSVQFSAWLQTRVKRELLGRVMSVLMFCAVGLVPISYAVAGVAARWSLKGLFVGAGTLLVATSVWALSGKAAREID
jgi:MFS family permease